ncbi:MAG: glycosyltransferase family 4 protein [Solirubrobacterales bacterium]|nr:glycosyltransferase family 4 protein [Solirubrobacterales bacterium]
MQTHEGRRGAQVKVSRHAGSDRSRQDKAGDAGKAILSTLFSNYPPIAVWDDRVEMLRPETQVGTGWQILRRAGSYDVLILDGARRCDRVAAALLRLHPRRPAIVMVEPHWEPEPWWKGMLNRADIRLIDGSRTTFCVLSRFEVDAFPRTWGPLRGRVQFAPWPVTLKQPDFASLTTDGGRVFAGGNSLRDYDLLISAAAGVSAPIDIVTSTLSAEQMAACPSNVHARPLPPAAYDELLFAASVVVVPLRARYDRTSGQTTYVNAMALGKPIVVTDAPGVRDYVEDGETGVIVPPGDSDALAGAVQGLLDDRRERERLGRQAQEQALERFPLTNYMRSLLEAADIALAGSSG